jgi:hypothetical protein
MSFYSHDIVSIQRTTFSAKKRETLNSEITLHYHSHPHPNVIRVAFSFRSEETLGNENADRLIFD